MFLRNLLQPQLFFAIAGLLFGLAMIALTPPFQVPDEINHFARAFQISEGQLIPTRTTDRLGGELPSALGEFSQEWEGFIGKKEAKTNFQKLESTAKIRLHNQVEWYDFPNTAVYSFLNYLPQATGIRIMQIFTSSMLAIYYGSRVCSLLFWLAIVYFSIRIIPVQKWLMAALALLPMSLYINSSLSADLVINALGFFWIAWILRLKFVKQRLRTGHFIFILGFSLLLPQLKLVYAPLLLLVLMIPRAHFNTKGQFWGMLLLMAALFFASTAWNNARLNELYIPYAQYAPEAGWVHLAEGANKNAQMEHLITHKGHFIKVLGQSLIKAFPMYSVGYVGTFGWLEYGLPGWLVGFFYLFLFMLSMVSFSQFHFRPFDRFVLLFGLISMVALLILSQHLIWGMVGSSEVMNLQGRYFIPIFPLLFLLLTNRIFDFSKAIKYLAPLLSSALLITSMIIIWERFYGF